MKKVMKRIFAVILMMAICITSVVTTAPTTAQAATKYITRANFIELVIDEMGITVDNSIKSPYVTKALELGLINKKTFLNYNLKINKADAAIILVRADEYLNGVTVSDELVNEIIDCRISDINKISNAKKPYLAKAYALGYIKGNSNGTYSTDRTFNPTYKITLDYAKQLVAMINKTSLRHEISPDGQLIRTTNLSEWAKFYPYILASYPNSYYDWEFRYMKLVDKNQNLIYGTSKLIDLTDYASPKDKFDFMNGTSYFFKDYYGRQLCTAKEMYDLYADEWVEKTRKYLELVFNVNYKTISNNNDKWMKAVLATTHQAGQTDCSNLTELNRYLTKMKSNKTVIECSTIALDKSTMYIKGGEWYIRAYVKYRVNSSLSLERESLSPLAYTYYSYPKYNNLVVGEWRDCYLDIQVAVGKNANGVYEAVINDYFHDTRLIIK